MSKIMKKKERNDFRKKILCLHTSRDHQIDQNL